MLSEEVIEKVIERLTRRIEQGNTYILEQIGKSIKEIGTLNPTQAKQLYQIIKYGGDFDKIIKKLAEITKLNEKDIYKIFDEIAKSDYNYAKQFYDYKKKKFIPYEKNVALKKQVEALASITVKEYRNLSKTLAFTRRVNGKVVYTPLARAYEDTLDKAILSVLQGKTSFQEEMYSTLKELAESGIKTVDYATGRSLRLDSAVRMQMKGALRNLHNEIQEQVGKEFEADGVEISVHSHPAPDHAEVQGRQFSINQYDENGKLIKEGEFEKFQSDRDAKDYTGKLFPAEFNGRDRRSISQYNCYHYTFSIVLGVSKPEYSNEQLQEIIDDTNQKIEFDGKKYDKYQCTQLQRKLELEIRKQKDVQITAKASGNNKLLLESQMRITQLTRKYRDLSEASGLPTKMERMRVPGYKRTKVNLQKNYKEIEYAKENNYIWHSTENLEEIIKENKILSPSLAIGKEINKKVKYGSQIIEFKPELLENVNKNTILYKDDGGNKFSNRNGQFNNLMQMLKDDPKVYNELKFNNNLESLKYIEKVYIRQDEPQNIINLLKENNINYEIYNDYRIRGFIKKNKKR